MFYDVQVPDPKPGQRQISALVVLTPAESRRLLAKTTVSLSEVKNAWENGTIIIARGVTTAYVTEELLGITIETKAAQSVGLICGGITNNHAGPPPCTSHVIRKGKVVEGADSNVEILSFGPEDVIIKGGNAVDTQGTAGVLATNPKGGTIGMCWPIVTPRGSHLIMPIGLEKLIPSVVEAGKHTGIYHFKYSTGLPAKVIPVDLGKVITEIQAFAIMAGVRSYHVASGGVCGSEGSVVLSLTGTEDRIEKAMALVKSIKGEPPARSPVSNIVLSSASEYNYDATAQYARLRR